MTSCVAAEGINRATWDETKTANRWISVIYARTETHSRISALGSARVICRVESILLLGGGKCSLHAVGHLPREKIFFKTHM